MSTKSKATPYVLCNCCRIALSHPNRNAEKSPSAMKKHLRGCTPYQKSVRNMSSDNQTLSDLFGSQHNQLMNRDRLKETVLRIIISGNLPFSFVDSLEFQALLQEAYPSCPPLNWKSARDYLQSVVDRTKEDLKAKLAANDSKISLVLDAWTTRSSLSFLGTLLPPLLRCNGIQLFMCLVTPFPVTTCNRM